MVLANDGFAAMEIDPSHISYCTYPRSSMHNNRPEGVHSSTTLLVHSLTSTLISISRTLVFIMLLLSLTLTEQLLLIALPRKRII